MAATAGVVELPPRARRILIGVLNRNTIHGTTSACAENTINIVTFLSILWNYLRVRGEYSPIKYRIAASRELPPRARRIHPNAHFFGAEPGTTSACAENTLTADTIPSSAWNYLRVRGEYINR